MSSDTIQFLRLRRQGVDPAAALQAQMDQSEQTLDARIRQATQQLLARQHAVENQVDALMQRLSAIDITRDGRQSMEDCQRALTELRSVQTQLQNGLREKQDEWKARGQDVKALTAQLESLQSLLKIQLPSQTESFLIQCGQRIVKKIGKS